jgi:transposase-like protein
LTVSTPRIRNDGYREISGVKLADNEESIFREDVFSVLKRKYGEEIRVKSIEIK